LNRARNARSASINNKEQRMADPVKLHDMHQGKKQCDMYCQVKVVMHSNTWNQSVGIPDQVDHTHHVTSDCSIPDDGIERAIIHKIQFLYATLRTQTKQTH
jgi:hypothetical protein